MRPPPLAPFYVLLTCLSGCGALSYEDKAMAPQAEAAAYEGMLAEGASDRGPAFGGGGGGGDGAPGQSPAEPVLEIADDEQPQAKAPRTSGNQPEPGRSSPLLIYNAKLHMAVFQVASTQKKVIALAKAKHGFLARQDDRSVVVRVPARAFQATLDAIEKLGDVNHRQIEARDVTEEFRDLTIRLRNFEVVRGKLEKLLERADKVKDALEVQRELTQITEQIERLKGRLRFLEDRIAFSTITIHFAPAPRDDAGAAPPPFQLPFPWIRELGLSSLMDVR
ncbi:MAG TPA: DUF4349 domain-containing protein [Planctomycetes bacterium]|nr:DUF4349 domain-containing protein [Planctomycetota bacterium]